MPPSSEAENAMTSPDCTESDSGGTGSIVQEWLSFLQLPHYAPAFLDNGYDDLETVKQMREEDLRAIGISRGEDEELLLLSVKILRERGAAWVYFLSADSDAGKFARIK